MKLAFRFVLPLSIFLSLIGYALVPLIDSLTLKWFVRDLDIRSKLIASTVEESLADFFKQGMPSSRVQKFFERATQDERLFAIGFCDSNFQVKFKTLTFPAQYSCSEFNSLSKNDQRIIHDSKGPLHVAQHPIHLENTETDNIKVKSLVGTLILMHDMSFIDRRSNDTKKYVIILFGLIAATISAMTVIIAHFSMKGLLNGVRAILRGEVLSENLKKSTPPELAPLAKEFRALIQEIEGDRQSRDESQMHWDPKALKNILHDELAGEEVIIVSNREPYIHVKKNDKIEVQLPASGLVTALEPIMRACSGTWIAHGSGNADQLVVDENDCVSVPPNNPSYKIKRVWLTEEEEQGYYYGFSNEGLWPLCHIAHTRPVFRSKDWVEYEKINRRFAETVIQTSKTSNPVVLVQDYHLTLVPKMIRDKLPDATIITFWHIPWPNPESFGICPWREELLEGLLGSSIIGFHTKYHCNNFLETVDRYLETRIDRETSTISYQSKLTAIKSYPISIEWPTFEGNVKQEATIRAELGIASDVQIGVGIDRLDYTKGILERFMAIERFFELYPQWIGKFSFIQIAAPSRTSIEQYKQFDVQVRQLVESINSKYSLKGYHPIYLKLEHHHYAEINEHYRSAHFCFVSSLHDGMNLVAKEFVAARNDEQGVLILSQFAGASKELPEALIVNPYNSDQCARAIYTALEMSKSEQKARMKSMRALIKEYNVFRWAGRMLIDASKIRRKQRFLGKVKSGSLEKFVGDELK